MKTTYIYLRPSFKLIVWIEVITNLSLGMRWTVTSMYEKIDDRKKMFTRSIKQFMLSFAALTSTQNSIARQSLITPMSARPPRSS